MVSQATAVALTIRVSSKINVVVADGKEDKIGSFTHNKNQHVLIIGYERVSDNLSMVQHFC